MSGVSNNLKKKKKGFEILKQNFTSKSLQPPGIALGLNNLLLAFSFRAISMALKAPALSLISANNWNAREAEMAGEKNKIARTIIGLKYE